MRDISLLFLKEQGYSPTPCLFFWVTKCDTASKSIPRGGWGNMPAINSAFWCEVFQVAPLCTTLKKAKRPCALLRPGEEGRYLIFKALNEWEEQTCASESCTRIQDHSRIANEIGTPLLQIQKSFPKCVVHLGLYNQLEVGKAACLHPGKVPNPVNIPSFSMAAMSDWPALMASGSTGSADRPPYCKPAKNLD